MPNQTATQENSAAGAIPAAPWHVQGVSVLPDYRLALIFRDELIGTADLSAIEKTATPGVYAPLVDRDFFNQVQIELGVLTWPNAADLDPAWLNENLSKAKTWSVPF